MLNTQESHPCCITLIFMLFFLTDTYSGITWALGTADSSLLPIPFASLLQTIQSLWILCETEMHRESEKFSCKKNTWVLAHELCDIYFNVQIFSYVTSLLCSGWLRMSDKWPPLRHCNVAIYLNDFRREAHSRRANSFMQWSRHILCS